jgi:hypothetical protein
MKLEHFTPAATMLLVEHYEATEQKQGSLYIPTSVDRSAPMGRVLKRGSACEGVKEGDIVVMRNAPQIPLVFEDNLKFTALTSMYDIAGIYSEPNDSI